MKVILKQDVAKIGRRGAVVEVPRGFAQNKLIPRGLAEEATKMSLARAAQHAEKTAAQRAADDESFKSALATLAGTAVMISAAANENGHLFQAVKPEAIAAALAEKGVTVPEDAIKIHAPIKATGTHTIGLQSGALEGELEVEVVASS